MWSHPPSPTPRWWLFLWGVLQACPTQGSVLLAQPLPQKLMSPGYPEPYVKGQESSTDIEAPEGFAVRLVFQDFDLEPSPDCDRDYVSVSWEGLCGGSLSAWSPGAAGPEVRGLPGRPGVPSAQPPTGGPVPTCAPCRLGPIEEDRTAGLALPLEVS